MPTWRPLMPELVAQNVEIPFVLKMCLCGCVCVCSACTAHWSIRDIAVGLATRLWRGRSEVRIPARVRYFCLLQTSTLCGPHTLLFNGTGIVSLMPERHVDHIPPSSVEVKNEWSFILLALLCHRGLYWHKLTFTRYLCLFIRVCIPVCVCVHERNVVQMVNLLVCDRKDLFRILARTPSS